MLPAALETLGAYDCLYVSPHADDAALACVGRMLSDRTRSLRILVLGLFEDSGAASPVSEALAHLGADYVPVGMPPARRRHRDDASFRSLAGKRRPEDEEWRHRGARILDDLGSRTRALHVYAPLGVGGHIDHRLAHDAALEGFAGKPGRNVFFYEERPEAFVPGAVRIRLGLLGARLPPGATRAAERAGLARYVLRFPLAPSLRRDFRGLGDRVGCLAFAARQWREARGWNPQRSFGPRLQPILHAHEGDAAAAQAQLLRALAPAGSRPARFASRFAHLAAAYSRRLGPAAHMERYWLLLPSSDDAYVAPTAVG